MPLFRNKDIAWACVWNGRIYILDLLGVTHWIDIATGQITEERIDLGVNPTHQLHHYFLEIGDNAVEVGSLRGHCGSISFNRCDGWSGSPSWEEVVTDQYKVSSYGSNHIDISYQERSWYTNDTFETICYDDLQTKPFTMTPYLIRSVEDDGTNEDITYCEPYRRDTLYWKDKAYLAVFDGKVYYDVVNDSSPVKYARAKLVYDQRPCEDAFCLRVGDLFYLIDGDKFITYSISQNTTTIKTLPFRPIKGIYVPHFKKLVLYSYDTLAF